MEEQKPSLNLNLKELIASGGPFKIISADGTEMTCPDVTVLRERLQDLDPGAYVLTDSKQITRPMFVPEDDEEEIEEPPADPRREELDAMRRLAKTEAELNREFYASMLQAQQQSFAQTLSIIRENEKVIDRRLKLVMDELQNRNNENDEDLEAGTEPGWIQSLVQALQGLQPKESPPAPMPGTDED